MRITQAKNGAASSAALNPAGSSTYTFVSHPDVGLNDGQNYTVPEESNPTPTLGAGGAGGAGGPGNNEHDGKDGPVGGETRERFRDGCFSEASRRRDGISWRCATCPTPPTRPPSLTPPAPPC